MLLFSAVVIIGPTASGKTALAHELADRLQETYGLGTELLNLDAFQFFREVSIGTAKPSEIESEKYRYHGIDLVPIDGGLDAESYATYAHKTCAEIQARGNLPICVGGSGLYLRAFLHGLDKLPVREEWLRNFLRTEAGRYGWPEIHNWLKILDPIRAKELHPNDKTRVERAFEICLLTGKPASSQRSKTQALDLQSTLFKSYVVHVEKDDTCLKERIFQRTQLMLESGWMEEVRQLFSKYGPEISQLQSFKAIGYFDILNHLLEAENLHTAASQFNDLTEKISTLTWQYARRQSTWNAKEKKDFLSSGEREGEEFETLLHSIRTFCFSDVHGTPLAEQFLLSRENTVFHKFMQILLQN